MFRLYHQPNFLLGCTALRFKGLSPSKEFRLAPTPVAEFHSQWDSRLTFNYYINNCLALDCHITLSVT